jgi:hypothetical protein
VVPNDADRAEGDPDHRGRQVRASHLIAPFSNAGDEAGERTRRYVQRPPRSK